MKIKGLFFILLVVYLSCTTEAKQCEDKKGTTSTDWSKLRRVWYVQKSFGDAYYRLFDKCITDTYILQKNDNLIIRSRSYINKLIPIRRESQNTIEQTGISDFVIKSNGIFSSDQPITFLASDYTNYAILWSCQNGLFSASESSWILTTKREPNFTPEVQKEIENQLQKYGLSLEQYGDVSQSSCD